MFFIYEIFQRIIFFFLFLLSKVVVNKKFKRYCEIRSPKNFIHELDKIKLLYQSSIKNRENNPIFWFHVASAGEMEQAIPVARKLNEKIGARFFVTYYSPSTEPFLKNFPAKIGVVGLPIDVRKFYKKVFSLFPIKKVFFVRYDIWPSLFNVCKKNNIEINLISASAIKTKKGLLGFLSEIWSNIFYRKFSNIFAVSQEDVNYFSKFLPKSKIYFSGDAKWARAYERAVSGVNKKKEKEFSLFYSFCLAQKELLHKKTVVLGSPHAEEHKLALDCATLKEKLFLIYVPHNAEPKNCLNILDDFYSVGIKAVLYSELVKKVSEEIQENGFELNKDYILKNNEFELEHNKLRLPSNIYNIKKEYNFSSSLMSYCEVVIVDKVGFLAEIYELGDIAIVGGGFDGQIHNVLEPAAHGVPVLIGNIFLRAREAKELVKMGAISFQNRNELFQFLVQWVSLIEPGADSTHPAMRLGQAKSKTLELFKSIPDTSEIILRALFNERSDNS